MSNAALLATRYAGRPLLLTPSAARELAMRIRGVDQRAFARPGRFEAFMRKVGLAGRGPAMAWDDDDDFGPPPPMEDRLAYSPRWAGEIEDTGYCWSLKSNIALMNCDTPLVARGEEFCGVVYHGYDTLLMAMREATADERVRGVFLRLETPGGIVDGGLSTLSAFMREAREAAGGKPIWVYADQACSAGYWIAAQADRIIAPSVGMVGSIGAVMVHENWADRLAEDGIEITSIEFPDGGDKTEGAWWKALSERAKAAWKADVAECGRLFLADVIAGRQAFTEAALLATQAGVFMAHHADAERSGRDLGFVDDIMGEEEAFAALVDHVSASASGNSSADRAPGSRAAATTPKEAPMAQPATNKPAAQVAHSKAALAAKMARAAADKAVLRAEQLEAEASVDVDGGEGDGDAAPEAAADEAEGDEDDKAEEEDDATEAAASDPAAADPAAIAASAEAKTHPELALAAIQSGQTLSQFKASVAAVGAAPKASRLDRALAGSSRLGPDGKGKTEGAASLGSVVAARIERNRAARSGG